MIRTQVYLPDDLHRDLTLLAKMQDKNISQLIREGAKAVIKKSSASRTKNEKEWGKRFFGAIHTKKRTNAVDVFHDYYEKDAI